ncbi:MAG: DUF4179 domain-containing protein [Clostridiaceae bacterium]|nr:DUF4179 domain-containing protein [Clostridiaceae bacterium]
MGKDLIFDDVLREKANNEKLDLPEDIKLKLGETLANLPERRRKDIGFIKKFSAVAAIIIVVISGISFSFPAYARNVPVVSSVFQFLSEKNIIDKDYVKYSSDLNMSKTSNGVTVTINSIVYDRISLNIGYTVESENEFKSLPYIFTKNMKINGKAVNFGGGDGGYLKDKKTYIGVSTVDNTQEYLPEEFIMDLNPTELGRDISGNWNFKFKVSTEKVKTKVQRISTAIDLSSIIPKLKVKEVIITPINTVLRTSEKYNANSFEGGVNYIALDDKGRALENKSSQSDGSSKTDLLYTQFNFGNIYEDSKSVTFIPYVETKVAREKNKAHSTEVDFMEVKLNLNTETSLSQGDFGEYKITQIEFLKDITLIHYECNKMLASMFPYQLIITDGQDESYSFSKDKVRRLEGEINKYIATLPSLSKDKQYKLKAKDFAKTYEVREDLKFSVEIK